MNVVSVAKDFTRFPAGRYTRNGETSGQAFRERFLEGPLARGEDVVIELDGTVGYGSSFLEEAFGGLVRSLQLPAATLLQRLTIRTSDPTLTEEITDYINEADRARR